MRASSWTFAYLRLASLGQQIKFLCIWPKYALVGLDYHSIFTYMEVRYITLLHYRYRIHEDVQRKTLGKIDFEGIRWRGISNILASMILNNKFRLKAIKSMLNVFSLTKLYAVGSWKTQIRCIVLDAKLSFSIENKSTRQNTLKILTESTSRHTFFLHELPLLTSSLVL